MILGTKVKWVTTSGVNGSGQIIANGLSPRDGVCHYLVAVDAPAGEEHRVIHCAETWLTEVKDESV